MERGRAKPVLGSDASGGDAMPAVRPFRSGSAEANGDEFRRIAGTSPHNTVCLHLLASGAHCAHVGSPDFLAATSRMTSPVLNLDRRDTVGIDIGDDHAVGSAAAIVPQGRARGRAAARRCRLDPGSRSGPSLALVRQFAEVERDALSLPFLSKVSFTDELAPCCRSAREIAGIGTGLPLTAVITSPATMPALAAGPPAAVRPPGRLARLEAEALGDLGRDRLDLHTDQPRSPSFVLELATTVFTVSEGIGRRCPPSRRRREDRVFTRSRCVA